MHAKKGLALPCLKAKECLIDESVLLMQWSQTIKGHFGIRRDMRFVWFPIFIVTCGFSFAAQEKISSKSDVALKFSEITGMTSQRETESTIPDTECLPCCGPTPAPYWIEARHIEAKGVGYTKGYTTLEGFFTVPSLLPKHWTPFLDLRGHVFNDGKFASNVGVGIRCFNSWVWGANAYWDWRRTSHQTYNQVSAGVEAIGKRVDFRANGYYPVGKTESQIYNKGGFYKFEGHSLLLRGKREFAMLGANAEIGVHALDGKTIQLYAAAGPYYFEGKGKVAWGGEGRFQCLAYDRLRLQVSGSWDRVFHGIVQGEIGFVIPFGRKSEIERRPQYACSQETAVYQRALQRVDRFEIPVVDTKKNPFPAIDPATGQPFFFIFVNNTSSSNGTFESPYPTLALAQANSAPNHIIYVFQGNGTSSGMDAGIALKNNQRLLGAGIPQPLTTTDGTIVIPPFSNGNPVIANILGNVVALANGNQVSGFNIVTSGATAGIFGASGTTGGTVTYNSITGSFSYGIDLTGSGAFVLSNNSVSNPTLGGIRFTSNGGTSAQSTIANNTVIQHAGGFGHAGIVYSGSGTFDISNNQILGIMGATAQGIRMQTIAGGVTLEGTVANNTVQNTTLSGIGFNADLSGALRIQATGNTITPNSAVSNGMFIGFSYGPAGMIQATASNNTITSALDGILLSPSADGQCFVVEGNLISSLARDGVRLAAIGSGTKRVSINQNTVNSPGVGFYGVNASTVSPSTLCLNLTIIRWRAGRVTR